MTDSTSWQEASKNAIPAWKQVMTKDADGHMVDWAFLRSLDLKNGIGAGLDADPVKGLAHDYAVRRRLEAIASPMQTAFNTDWNRIIPNYSLPRAIAYADRRLNDEILWLQKKGEERGLDVPEDDDEEIQAERKRLASEARASWSKPKAEKKPDDKPVWDWRMAFLPGQKANKVVGIDIETTGLNPYRTWIIDVGYEYMNINPDDDGTIDGTPVDTSIYTVDYYKGEGAYDAARDTYGFSDTLHRLGNPTEDITGISESDLTGHLPFDEDGERQVALLEVLKSAPFVAHNARYEHSYFTANLTGYAESYRDGLITYMDTMVMSQKWDKAGDAERPHGSNRLEDYAKRWSAMPQDGKERHLGLEDSHIMLVAMKNHLRYLKENGEGAWNPDLPIWGEGGKHTKASSRK